jgi:hypothetical protein
MSCSCNTAPIVTDDSTVESAYLEQARQRAMNYVEEGFFRKVFEQECTQALKNQNDGLNPLREEVKSLKRAKAVQCFVCDHCQAVIAKSEDGFVIQGNIYNANFNNPGGLIGDNIPPPDSASNVVKRTVMCKLCLVKILNLEAKPKEIRYKESYKALDKYPVPESLVQACATRPERPYTTEPPENFQTLYTRASTPTESPVREYIPEYARER